MDTYAEEVAEGVKALLGGPFATKEVVVKYVSDHLRSEYERGKKHGADDRKMIERQNQLQGREINRLKGEIGQLKLELFKKSRSESNKVKPAASG